MEKITKLMSVLALGAVMTMVSCQREEPIVETPEEAGVSKVTVTVNAGYNGQTKSAVVTDGTTRKLTFTEGDKLYVRGVILSDDDMDYGHYDRYLLIGYLTVTPGSISDDGTSASFTGDLEVYEAYLDKYYEEEKVVDAEEWWEGEIYHEEEWHNEYVCQNAVISYNASSYVFSTTDPLSECEKAVATLVHDGNSYTFNVDSEYNGYYHYTGVSPDVNALMIYYLDVDGLYDDSTSSFDLRPTVGEPILNCSISGLAPSGIYFMRYYSGVIENSLNQCGSGYVYADGAGQTGFAFFGDITANSYHLLRFENYTDQSDVRIASFGKKSFASKVYNATREAYPANVNLDTMYSTDANSVKYYAARDGQTLTGNFGGDEGYITIADGATVTLNIEDFHAPYRCNHAPIHCLGDANIILAGGMNAIVMAGNSSYYPAVFVPENKTLTISGTGELIADGLEACAAGIGGGPGHNCGNIVIAGGIISAYGGKDKASIGGGDNSRCGNITISGGVIKEARYNGNENSYGAGIGSGASGSCGTITISGGRVGGEIGSYLYKGAFARQDAAGIGSGQFGSCGTITIGADITFVMASGRNGAYNRIGSLFTSPCDVYFGDFKVYDKTAKKWYNSETGDYDEDCPESGNYGGLTFQDLGENWVLTPVTP